MARALHLTALVAVGLLLAVGSPAAAEEDLDLHPQQDLQQVEAAMVALQQTPDYTR